MPENLSAPPYRKPAWKYTLTWALVLAVRLNPLRLPNVEPLLATVMPVARDGGALVGLIYPASAIVVYDAFTSGIGPWTYLTAAAYAAVGLAARWFFARRRGTALNYLGFAVAATIAYDAVTGLSMGPLLFGQSLQGALVGQVPFTLLHLGGNAVLAVTLSPVVGQWLQSVPATAAVRPSGSPRTATQPYPKRG